MLATLPSAPMASQHRYELLVLGIRSLQRRDHRFQGRRVWRRRGDLLTRISILRQGHGEPNSRPESHVNRRSIAGNLGRNYLIERPDIK